MTYLSNRVLFLDIETTGLKPGINRMIELGIIETIDGEFTGHNLHLYFKANQPSDPAALAVHGISEDFLMDKQPFSFYVEEILAYLKDAHSIIIHNAIFDVSFLSYELEELGYLPFPYLVRSIKDSLSLARTLHAGSKNDLNSLCERYCISTEKRILHGGLVDSYLLAQVFFKMIETFPHAEQIQDFKEDVQFPQDMVFDLSVHNNPLLVGTTSELEQQTHRNMMMFLEIAPEICKLRKEHEENLYFYDPEEE